MNWEALDSSQYTVGALQTLSSGRQLPKDISMQLTVGPDTLWVAAQELKTSVHVQAWIRELDSRSFVSRDTIGSSREGKPIHLLEIGKGNDQKMIFVLSRQHPPEVTGFLAMQAFVETIASDHETAVAFRKAFKTYVVPFANPDGVDNGHWRHNAGGIDLNRDWVNVNQPEVAAIQQFMKSKVSEGKGKFYFGVDFHSTWEDIYYTVSPELKGNAPGLVPDMIREMATELNLDPNIRPGLSDNPINSSKYFFQEFGAEALTYEIGDNTPRTLLRKKGEVSALKLMTLLLAESEK
jgi:predicted deacylase